MKKDKDSRVLSLIVKGDRHAAALAASDRGIPFAFQRETERETIGRTPIAFADDVCKWFADCPTVPPFPIGTLLLSTILEG